MKVTTQKIDNHKLVLEIEVPQEQVAKSVDRAYHKLANQVNIPGFRKGKVPRQILEMRIGKPALLQEAFELMASGVYQQALDQEKIVPVTEPDVEIVTLQEDQPLVFKATVVPKPELQLGDYKGLKADQKAEPVTDEQVNEQLSAMQNRGAKMVVAEDAVLANGDFAIIDFEGFVDGKPFKGGDAKGYLLELGSGSFIPGFEDQLIGAKAGEERQVKVTFPGDYFVSELAGKEAEFKVQIQDVKRKELPALDDEFAKDVSDFDTLEALKADIRNKLEKAAEQKAERDFRAAILKQAVDNATVDIPDVMVEHKIDNMLENLDINLQNHGSTLQQYLEYAKTDMDTLRKNYREAAVYNVKSDLLLEAVAKAENLEAKPEDMEQEIAHMAEEYQASVDEVRKIVLEQGRLGILVQTVLRKKAAQIILDSAIKE